MSSRYFFAGIAVDGSGNAYLTGTTFSTDFPRVNQIPGACLGLCGRGNSQDVFVTKINAAGTALVYSSYVGSSGSDIGFGIAVDRSGNAYLAGLTLSSDFPRVNQIPGACNGDCGNSLNYDAYVTKINAAGSALVYSSYLGGSENDYARGIAVDGSGNAYLAGSSGFDRLSRREPDPGRLRSEFLRRLRSQDQCCGQCAGLFQPLRRQQRYDKRTPSLWTASGSAYVTGETRSSDFPR